MKNLRKTIFILISLISILFCFSISGVAEENNITIVCSNSILADFASNLITENVTIEYIMPSGVCPADEPGAPKPFPGRWPRPQRCVC